MSGRCLSARVRGAAGVGSELARARASLSCTRTAEPCPPARRGAARPWLQSPGCAGSARNTPSGASMRCELRVADRHRPAREHAPFVVAAGELLLVLLALLIAVVQLGDGCVAPVHDAQPVLEAGGAAQAQVALAPVFFEAHVREVGRRRDRPAGCCATSAAGRAARTGCSSACSAPSARRSPSRPGPAARGSSRGRPPGTPPAPPRSWCADPAGGSRDRAATALPRRWDPTRCFGLRAARERQDNRKGEENLCTPVRLRRKGAGPKARPARRSDSSRIPVGPGSSGVRPPGRRWPADRLLRGRARAKVPVRRAVPRRWAAPACGSGPPPRHRRPA